MAYRPSSEEIASPEPIHEILLSMEPDELRALFRHLRDTYDLLHQEAATGVLVAPPSDSPAPSTMRAVAICRDVAELLDTTADT